MKKILLVIGLLFLTACGNEELTVIDSASWPSEIPTCNCGTQIESNQNYTKLLITGVTEEEKNAYFEILRNEYTGVITDTDTYYQGYNSQNKNLTVEYKDNQLTITQK